MRVTKTTWQADDSDVKGIVQGRHTGTNQRGELVYSLLATAFVPRRNPNS